MFYAMGTGSEQREAKREAKFMSGIHNQTPNKHINIYLIQIGIAQRTAALQKTIPLVSLAFQLFQLSNTQSNKRHNYMCIGSEQWEANI